jgi:hypothetical protein
MTTKTALTVTEQRVARIRGEIALSDALVEKVLEPGIDYGLHPGTRSQALKDPGANTIINAFGCYPKAEVLFREVNEDRISYVIDIALISRDDGLAKATGTGAASTKETKYGYRWTMDPEGFGYDRAGLKKRKRGDVEEFRIINPEWSELENTILKMARKRAEVDAAMALPGVSRFLAKLNAGVVPGRRAGPPGEDWSGFWSRARALGLDSNQVHEILGVGSMKEWTDQGRTLNDAVRKLAEVFSRPEDIEEHGDE